MTPSKSCLCICAQDYMNDGKIFKCNCIFLICCYQYSFKWQISPTSFCILTIPDMGRLLIHHLYFLLISLLACHCPTVSGLFEWLRQTEAPPAAAPPPPSVVPALLAKDAQFEMATADEKFLAEAKQMDISQLDGCHYGVKFSLLVLKYRVWEGTAAKPLSSWEYLIKTTLFAIVGSQ